MRTFRSTANTAPRQQLLPAPRVEGAPEERFADLYRWLDDAYLGRHGIDPALTVQAAGALALERLLAFPCVLGASIELLDPHGELRVLATHQADVAAIGCARTAFDTGTGTRGQLTLLTGAASHSRDEARLFKAVGNQVATALERAAWQARLGARSEALEAGRKLLTTVVTTGSALVCMVDAAGVIRLFNPACEATLGWRADEALGQPCGHVFRSAGGAAPMQSIGGLPPHDDGTVNTHGDWIARDGTIRSIVWSTAWVRQADGTVDYCISTGVDVTALRGAEEQLRYLGNFDALTSLPNRILLRDRVVQLQEQVSANGKLIGFLLVKPERLGLISGNLGIEAEQAILVEIASRLQKWNQGSDSVARVGERAFAIVAVRTGATDFSALARDVLAAMAAPFLVEEQELHLDHCIGIAIFPNDGDDYDTVRKSAEAAMRRAMASKAQRYAFYHPQLNQGAQERFKFESALRRALERDELVLHYQPQVSLSSGAVIGVEALLRWQHPELGLIAPGRFIALAEETGLILPIGEWVLRRACEQSCAWQRDGVPPVPVSVNLSARQFSANIAATVARVLADTGLDPTLLELELTESASMEDPQRTFEVLRQLKRMGVKLAIDDFGTGYSNLNYLKRFPVDKLKLDQSFVKDLTRDPDDLSIARAVIAMAHSLRLKVIAEGVETPGQLGLLARHGCDEIQGYLFSRPVDAAACAALLRDGTRLALGMLQRQPYQRTLLYVDDGTDLPAAIRRAKGLRVLVAADVAAAFEILATADVGVILCDQRMPGMSGTEFLARVKHMVPSATRMVLSGCADLQTVADAVDHGAIFRFLAKPCSEQQLIEALHEGFGAFESRPR